MDPLCSSLQVIGFAAFKPRQRGWDFRRFQISRGDGCVGIFPRPLGITVRLAVFIPWAEWEALPRSAWTQSSRPDDRGHEVVVGTVLLVP